MTTTEHQVLTTTASKYFFFFFFFKKKKKKKKKKTHPRCPHHRHQRHDKPGGAGPQGRRTRRSTVYQQHVPKGRMLTPLSGPCGSGWWLWAAVSAFVPRDCHSFFLTADARIGRRSFVGLDEHD